VAQWRAQVVRNRIGKCFQLFVAGCECSRPLRDALLKLGVEFLNFFIGLLQPGYVHLIGSDRFQFGHMANHLQEE